jgi:predicted RNA-binding protein YlxR (DUF448 family)
VVRGSDGRPRIDIVGTASGRGAYLHRDIECARSATSRGSLALALRARADPEGAARLQADIEEIVRQ